MDQVIASKQKSILVGGVAAGIIVLAFVRMYQTGQTCSWEPVMWYTLSGASIAILAQLIYGYYMTYKKPGSM
ncbi:hypothetical protein [Scale drop disease virus]|uniref:Uncharacterized protein n=1 Tax=Scale drop disease virus TaxID=1697349 RepID=A0A7D5YKL8_9VIRU|nr:hypothetical protein [Scale drop disease virus]QXJ13651.1 hypothetical protein PMJGCIOK_00084 [Scale drop disease virus]UNH60723.1 hypothetical protein SDDV_ORF054 [Scale drop disease virus]